MLRFHAGEPGGDRGKADNSSADGADEMAASRCYGSNLQRVPVRQVLPAAECRRAVERWSLLVGGQVSRVAHAAAISHRSRLVTHHRWCADNFIIIVVVTKFHDSFHLTVGISPEWVHRLWSLDLVLLGSYFNFFRCKCNILSCYGRPNIFCTVCVIISYRSMIAEN